jgi:CheY-like chemotaxis protein
VAAPDCAIFDLQTPGTGGLELQEALAQVDESLPVVFLTGYGDVPTSVQAMKGGAVDFLTKPVQGEALQISISTGISPRLPKKCRLNLQPLGNGYYPDRIPLLYLWPLNQGAIEASVESRSLAEKPRFPTSE